MPTSAHSASSPASPVAAGRGPRLSSVERRTEVIAAAVQAFATGGLAGTSTEEIARLAGVSQPYLFRLFGSKRELFLAAVGRSYERIETTFAEAARHPATDAADMDPVLHSMGRAYGDLLADKALLRLQLHAFAACDDPVVRSYVRQRFADLVADVAARANVPVASLRDFFAQGMLLNVAAAMELTDSHVAWQAICEGGPA